MSIRQQTASLMSTSTLSTNSKIHSLEFEIISIRKQLDTVIESMGRNEVMQNTHQKSFADILQTLLSRSQANEDLKIMLTEYKRSIELKLQSLEIYLRKLQPTPHTPTASSSSSIRSRQMVRITNPAEVPIPSDDATHPVQDIGNPITDQDYQEITGSEVEENEEDIFNICLFPEKSIIKPKTPTKKKRTIKPSEQPIPSLRNPSPNAHSIVSTKRGKRKRVSVPMQLNFEFQPRAAAMKARGALSRYHYM